MERKVQETAEVLRRVIRQRNQIVASTLCREGIGPGQPPILRTLSKCESMTQRELAEALQLRAPTVTAALKRMEKAGLVQRIADEKDQRKLLVSLTEEGRARDRRCLESLGKMEERTFDGFTDDELDQLASFLQRMMKNNCAARKEENNA